MSFWLFHFRVAGELNSRERHSAHGIGHARRCLTLAAETQRRGIEVSLVANESDATRAFIDSFGLVYTPEDGLPDLLAGGKCLVACSDINYLDEAYFELIRSHAVSVCLAPRGPGKYLADLSFRDVYFEDEAPPENSPCLQFRGPEYAVPHPSFNIMRARMEQGLVSRIPRTVFVSMGGVDAFDQTRRVVSELAGLPDSWRIHVLVGPLYPHPDLLRVDLDRMSCETFVHQAPDNPMERLASCSYSVCATGLVAYESIGLGVPCLCVSLTPFHELRAMELENLGVALHAGRMDGPQSEMSLADRLISLDADPERADRLRTAGMRLVDGHGAQRIIDAIQCYLRNRKAVSGT